MMMSIKMYQLVTEIYSREQDLNDQRVRIESLSLRDRLARLLIQEHSKLLKPIDFKWASQIIQIYCFQHVHRKAKIWTLNVKL